MSEIEEFPYLLNQLLRSGTKPEDVVECVEASFAFSRKGCFVCHDAGITSSHFMCDDPNCQGFLNWCCHSCMVKQTTAKRRTYSEGWDCLGIGIGILCIKPCGRKNLKFDEDSIIECRNFENELVKKAFKLPGGNRKLSAKVKRGSKPTDGPKRSNKKNLSTKLVKFILEDAPKPFPFEWKHYDPRKMNQTNLTDEKTKNEIEKQLKDLSEEQLILEIDRYEEYEERREPLKEKLIELVTNDVSEKVSFKWTHYDPNKVYGEAALSTFGKKQPIRTQLEDLTEAQLRLEIARYMHALTLFIKDPFIDTAVDTERDEAGNEIYTDEDGNLLAADAEEEDKKRLKKVSTHRIVYRLPLGPLEKLRSKLDKRTFILERAVELKSLMNGSSSSSGAASSSSEIEDLKSTIDQLKKQADNDREANEQDRAAEAAKMASLTEENRKIVKQNESLEDKTTRLEKENSDRQSDVHDLKSVVGDKESLIEQLQSQLFASDTRDHEIEAFKEAATTQQSLYLQEKANVDRMHDEYKALEEKHNETDQKLTTTRNENKALESENAALESKNAGLASTIDQLKMDMKAMMTGDCNNNGSDSLPLLTASFSAKDPPTPPQVSQQSLPSHRHHNGEKETVHPKSAAAAASIPKTVLHLKKQQQRRQQQRRQQQQQQQQRQQLRLLRVEEDDDDDDDDDDEEEEEEEEEGKDDDEEEEEDEEEAGEKDGPKTWQEKCAEPGWTTNHSHVGKRVAKYFPCLAEGRKGECTLICRTSSFPRLPPISTLHFIMSNNPLSFSSFSIRSTKIVLRGSCQIPATF